MSSITPTLLYKTAAVLYGFTVPGHVIMGYQVVYPALSKISRARSEDRIGELGADNSWKFVTTSLAVSALLHYQWARTLGPKTLEETAVLALTNAHFFVSGSRYLAGGELKAGIALLAASTVGAAAYLLQYIAK